MGYGFIPWTYNYLPQKCPCHECEERVVGCHGKCQKYKNWQEQKQKAQRESLKNQNSYT